jgi:hypothetical protein
MTALAAPMDLRDREISVFPQRSSGAFRLGYLRKEPDSNVCYQQIPGSFGDFSMQRSGVRPLPFPRLTSAAGGRFRLLRGSFDIQFSKNYWLCFRSCAREHLRGKTTGDKIAGATLRLG